MTEKLFAEPSAAPPNAVAELPGAFSLFRPSVAALRRNLFAFFYVYSMPFIIAVSGGVILASGGHARGASREVFLGAGALALVAAIVVLLVSLPALSYTQLQSVRGEQVEYSEAMAASRYYFWRLWGVRLCSGGLLLLGFPLLVWGVVLYNGLLSLFAFLIFIVPGIFVMRRFLFASFLLLDKDTGVLAALHEGAALSKKYRKLTWGVVGVQMLIFIANVVPVIGSVIAAGGNVAYYCAPAVRYEQITQIEAAIEKRQKRSARKASAKVAKRSDGAGKAQSRTKNKS